MRSVFNKSEYRRLKHRPVKIIQLLMDDIKCCTERITKGYCSKDVDNIDIWFLNIIPDMLQSLMDKKMGVPKEIYDKILFPKDKQNWPDKDYLREKYNMK